MKKTLQFIIGLSIGGFLVWILFKDTDWNEVGNAISNIHWGWFALAHIPLWSSFLFRIIRWHYIVRAAQPTPFRQLASATQIGFLANFTMPGRAGEAIRALVLTRLSGIPFSKTFAFVALDRVTDLFGLIAVMLVSIFAFQPDGKVTIPEETFGVSLSITQDEYNFMAVGSAIFLFTIIGSFVVLFLKQEFLVGLTKKILNVFSSKLADLISGMMNHFADGLHVFRSPSDMFKALFYSMITWACAIFIFMAMMKSFGFNAPWYTAFIMQAIMAVFISVPGAPGFVGQFHMPVVLTLVMVMPSMNVDQAKAFAIVTHLVQLPPVIILGGYFLVKDGFGLTSLAKEGQEMSEHKSDSEETEKSTEDNSPEGN
jgi:hypothetical protein